MEKFKQFTPLFTAVICFIAVLTGLGFVHSLQLAPVKKDIAHLDQRLDGVETRLDGVETRLNEVETRLNRMSAELKGINTALIELKEVILSKK